MENKPEITVKYIMDKIGKEALRIAMDVSKSQINRHYTSGIMPASWSRHCENELGVKRLPDHLFTFKGLGK
jgi:hypothetical protein